MNPTVSNHLQSLRVLEPVRFRSMTVFPLNGSAEEGPDYVTLKRALDGPMVRVTEVSQGAGVRYPETRRPWCGKSENFADLSPA